MTILNQVVPFSSNFEFQTQKNEFDLQGFKITGFQPVSDAVNPPYTNRGGIELTSAFSSLPAHQSLIPPTNDFTCIVDYFAMTFSTVFMPDYFFEHNINGVYQNQTQDDIAQWLLLELEGHISHLNHRTEHRGINGYKNRVSLFRDDQLVGFIAWGGNNETMLLNLSGKGTSGVKMHLLRRFVEQLPYSKITRIDLAHDDIEGRIPIYGWKNQYFRGGFHRRGAKPNIRFIDDGGSGKGCTAVVGNKANGKEACMYEKGKQLGDKLSRWVRIEGRLTAVDRVIPFDAMTSPAMYLSGMYPAFEYLCIFYEPILMIKKTAEISFDHMIKHASKSYGKLVNVMLELGKSADEIVQSLARPGTPKRLQIPFPA